MFCHNCGKEVYRITTFENGISQCRYCPDKYVPQAIVGSYIKSASGIHETKSRRTAAHNNDISRRRLAEDGKTVIRDYNRKMFNL